MFKTLAMEKGEIYSNCFRKRNQPFHSTECENMSLSLALLSPSLTRRLMIRRKRTLFSAQSKSRRKRTLF